MSGPCSLPEGDKARWNELNEIVCDFHADCTPGQEKTDRHGYELTHVWVTRRVWLLKRNRLRTGKTR